ncbi:MAG TPA: PfkB family carbohydrate kinase [Kribbellaceae bacterium]
MTRRVLVVGDVLLDTDITGDVRRVCPDAPAPVVDVADAHDRAGGAGLAATLLARPGVTVTLATGLADDEPAKRLTALLTERLHTAAVVTTPGTRCKTRVRSAGQSLLRLDTDPPFGDGVLPCDTGLLRELLADADAVLVSDYAGGVAAHPEVRAMLARWCDRLPVVWDPHPRGAPPIAGVAAATPNRAEAVHFHGPGRLDVVARGLCDAWACSAVAVTDGANGVFTATGSGVTYTPVPARHPGDCCGAGDRFAGTLAAELAAGADPVTAVRTAVADTADWLSAGGVSARASGAVVATGNDDTLTLVRRTRAAGGTVVATGGCFDVLHAGHVASLEAAARLGDLLVVLLNSDDSVRRLKGPGRPVQCAADRRRVLQSLACVDAVEIFDGDDPRDPLRWLRPDIWAKGGDYRETSLPEASTVASWGGRVVLLPYLEGRSTTRILTRPEGDR